MEPQNNCTVPLQLVVVISLPPDGDHGLRGFSPKLALSFPRRAIALEHDSSFSSLEDAKEPSLELGAQGGEVYATASHPTPWWFLGGCWSWRVHRNHPGQETMSSKHLRSLPVLEVPSLGSPNQGGEAACPRVPEQRGAGWHPCNPRFAENESSFGFLLCERTQLLT